MLQFGVGVIVNWLIDLRVFDAVFLVGLML